ncbi:hypothetical protein DVH24_042747 [Malus domestica]|uniref:DEK-C domain-containing protein n=1 Tax=Malus domestica TaxID=3750 RepID=A0A498HYQ2_MALDO|nr:hypothetical protein DVH24_042747 [Malus domestica]
MVEDAQDGESPLKETHDIESQIKSAMRLRVPYFKEQSEVLKLLSVLYALCFGWVRRITTSLTFEGVRRVLEKDLGLETFALDVHKRFVKEHLVEGVVSGTLGYGLEVHVCTRAFVLEGAGDDNTSKTSGETEEKSLVKGEVAESLKRKSNKDAKETCSEDEEKMEDSPVMGLLTGHKVAKTGTEETKTTNQNKAPTESVIKSALRKRGSYIKANSEKITLAGLRRLLEEDLKLEKYTLDPFKKFISQQLDEVLESCEISEPATTAKKNVLKSAKRKASTKVRSDESSGSLDNKGSEEEDEVKPRSKSAPKGKMQKNAQRKASTKVRNNESSGSSDNESSEEEHEVKCRSKSALKGKMQNTDGHKKRKRMAKETNVSGKKRIKPPQKEPEDKSDAEDTGNVSEDDCSQSSAEKPIKKKEVSTTPAYGKRVEHLRSVIKACGMSVAPSVYKKVKQVPENKRETHLIKELEEILSREGLSAHPSEKGQETHPTLTVKGLMTFHGGVVSPHIFYPDFDTLVRILTIYYLISEIKEVKKKKERAKELEGIDMSNIVMSSRRRSTTSFVPPPKPKIPVESDSDDAESSDDDNDEADNSDKEENEVEDEDIEDNGNSDDNHSDEDEADDSD